MFYCLGPLLEHCLIVGNAWGNSAPFIAGEKGAGERAKGKGIVGAKQREKEGARQLRAVRGESKHTITRS